MASLDFDEYWKFSEYRPVALSGQFLQGAIHYYAKIELGNRSVADLSLLFDAENFPYVSEILQMGCSLHYSRAHSPGTERFPGPECHFNLDAIS